MKQLALTLAVLAATPLCGNAAKKNPFELVPARASATVIFPNVAEFRSKADKLLDATFGGPTWASMAIHYGETVLGIRDIYDPEQPIAIVWLNRSVVELSESDLKSRWRKPIAVGVAIKNFDKLATQLKTDPEELRNGKVVTQPGQMGYEHRHFKVDGDYLWIASHIGAFEHVLKGERMSNRTPKSRRKHLLQSNLMIVFSADWDEFNPEAASVEADRWIKDHPNADEEEEAALRELFEILQSSQQAVFGFRIEPTGIEMDLDLHFDPAKHDVIRKAVRRISPKGTPSTLAGLPANGKAGELIAAHAARTDGKATLPVISILLHDTFRIWDNWWDNLAGRGMLNRSQQFEVLGLFAEVWHRLDGYRTGLYRNGNEEALGLTSLVALLDTEDPEGFIQELRLLGGLIDGTEIDAEELSKDDTHSRRAIKKLIAQLASPDYATRQSATTKLMLIGGPALKFVERAEKSENSAVARRARHIVTRIRQKLKEERAGALEPALLSRLKPRFVFHEKAEEREGRTVHIIEIRTKQSDAVQKNVGRLFGPDWAEVRLVPLDSQVAVLFGSNTKLLDAMLKNVEAGRPGLADDPANGIYSRPLNSKHTGELHFSTQRFLALMNGKRLPQGDSEHELVSLAIALQPSHLNIEWRLPVKEIKRIMDEVRGR
jgi:hypothetical protein